MIVGGSGHIGHILRRCWLSSGHVVINVTRGQSNPYLPHAAWKQIQQVIADCDEENRAGTFARRIRDLEPDVEIDLICFTEDSNRQMVEALCGHTMHFLHCGTIWAHGHSTTVPSTEDQPPREPSGAYGIQKTRIESYLLDLSRRTNFPATVIMPGHIVGQGYIPLNQAGHFNPEVFAQIRHGEELCLLHLGLETVHHVQVLVGHWNDPEVQERLGVWSRAAGSMHRM